MGKSTISTESFSIAMLNYQRVTNNKSWLVVEPLKNIRRLDLLDDSSRYMEKKYVFFSKPPTTIQNLTIQNKNGISPTTIGISTIQLIGF